MDDGVAGAAGAGVAAGCHSRAVLAESRAVLAESRAVLAESRAVLAAGRRSRGGVAVEAGICDAASALVFDPPLVITPPRAAARSPP